MTKPGALTGEPDFMKLWAAQAVSSFGARISREGLPMTAILALGAGPAVLGVQGGADTVLQVQQIGFDGLGTVTHSITLKDG